MEPFFYLLIAANVVVEMFEDDYNDLKAAYQVALGSGSSTVSYVRNDTTYSLLTSFVMSVISAVDASGIFDETPVVCVPPGQVSTGDITANSIVFTWGAVGVAISYEYVVSTSSANPVGAGTAISTTHYTATGLTANTQYYLHVRSKCGEGNFSPWVHGSGTTTPQ